MINPQMLAQLQQHTQNLKAVIRVIYLESRLELILSAKVPEAEPLVPQMLEQLANQFAQQLGSFLRIEGELVEVGKKAQ